MSQTAYPLNQPEAFAGLKADTRFDEVETFAAGAAIPFGRGVSAEAGNTSTVVIPKKDSAKIVFSAVFITGNKINGKVNTVAFDEVTFADDHATTVAALVAAIDALAGVTAVLDSTDSTSKTILVESDGAEITIADLAVTAGTSQATATVTYSGDNVFRGVSLHSHLAIQPGTEVAQYVATDSVSVLRKGKVWVETSKAVDADDTAYVDLSASGKFTDASSGNLATGGTFRSTVSGAGLALLEIDL